MQKQVDDYLEEEIEPSFSISKSVRNASYQMLSDEHLGKCQQLVYTALLSSPDGLCDKEISAKTGLSISSVNGRRNELVQMGLVKATGIKRDYPDYNGNVRLNTIWGAVIS